MIKNKTVIVVGAGASKDLGLPLGTELKSKISTYLRNGSELREVFPVLVKPGENTGELQKAASFISKNVERAASIDNFLDNHSGSEEITLVGKLAIAACIARAEHDAALNAPDAQLSRHKRNVSGDEVNAKYFLEDLLPLVVRNHTVGDVVDSLKNLTFVIFNYDRCIERYILLWLSRNFDQDMGEVVKQNVGFHHVYGQLDEYEFKDHFSLRTSNPDFFLNPHSELPKIASRLKIFSEQKDAKVVSVINEKMLSARAVLFVGFAFEEQNMSLFKDSRGPGSKSVFATSFGFSEPDQRLIENELRNKLARYEENTHVAAVKGAALFHHFSMALRRQLRTL